VKCPPPLFIPSGSSPQFRLGTQSLAAHAVPAECSHNYNPAENHCNGVAYQPGASSAATAFFPTSQSAVTSYAWYITRSRKSVHPGARISSPTLCPLIEICTPRGQLHKYAQKPPALRLQMFGEEILRLRSATDFPVRGFKAGSWRNIANRFVPGSIVEFGRLPVSTGIQCSFANPPEGS